MNFLTVIKSLWQWYTRQHFLVYITIGFFGLFIDVGSYLLLTNAFYVTPYYANFIAMFVTLNNNFYWNTYFNFKKRDKIARRWLWFMSIGSLGIVVSELLMAYFMDVFFWDDELAKYATIPIIAVMQYSLHKIFTYK